MAAWRRLLAGLIPLVMLAPASLGARADEGSAQCAAPTNLYAESPETLQQCGFVIEPLESVRTEADGTRDYIYRVGSGTAIVPQPPVGFNFANATPAQLKRYGLPQRPLDGTSLPAWQEQMARVHVVPAGQFMLGAPWMTATPLTSSRWSGYTNTSSYDQFNTSYADYIEPSTTAACSGDAVVVWAGLGGWYTGRLAQAGTAPHAGNIPEHSAWWMVIPDFGGAQFFPGNYIIPAGHDVQVTIEWFPSTPEYGMTIYDSTVGATGQIFWPTSTYDGRTSEFIVERPTMNKLLPPIRNFGTVTFRAGQTNGIGMQNFPLSPINMVNASQTVLATPAQNSGQSFTDKWVKCG